MKYYTCLVVKYHNEDTYFSQPSFPMSSMSWRQNVEEATLVALCLSSCLSWI